MIRRAVLAAAVAASFAGPSQAAEDLGLWVDLDGTAYIQNLTSVAVSFDGYTISSKTSTLDPLGWNSIADQALSNTVGVIVYLGSGGLAFRETDSSSGNLSELTYFANHATIAAGAEFAIGKPFLTSPCTDATFEFKLAGVVVSSGPVDSIACPEPSTFLLTALAGVGLVAFRHRASYSARSLQPL